MSRSGVVQEPLTHCHKLVTLSTFWVSSEWRVIHIRIQSPSGARHGASVAG